MSTGNQWRVAAMAAGISFTLFFSGCGGDGGSSTNDVAPATLEGRSYDFSPNTGGQTAVTFSSPTSYTFQHETGAVEQGTYQSQRDGNTWNVTLTSDTGGQQVYNMTFASEAGGNFVLHRDGEADRFGPFTARSTAVSSGDINPPPPPTGTTIGASNGTTTGSSTTGSTTTSTSTGTTDTGTTTTTTGDSSTGTSTSTGATSSGSTTGTSTTGTATTGTSTTGTTTTGSTTGGSGTPSTDYNGFAPVSIVGRTMFGTRTFTSTGPSGQTHTYTFGNGTFHDSDAPEESDGTFTYSASHSSATLNLNYTGPATFSGDKHNINMTFTEKDRGTFQSIYTRGDGTEITINGTFEFQPIQ